MGDYGVAMLFLPQDEQGINAGMRIFEEGCAQLGLPLLFWRDVPVDPRDLGATARACMPTMKQAFLARPESCPQGIEFERLLYVCRRTIEKRIENPIAETIIDSYAKDLRALHISAQATITERLREHTHSVSKLYISCSMVTLLLPISTTRVRTSTLCCNLMELM